MPTGPKPIRIASLAYDTVALAAVLARVPGGPRFDQTTLTGAEGFAGVDGLFRLLPDGTTERGWGVMELTREGFGVVDPAPASFQTPAF